MKIIPCDKNDIVLNRIIRMLTVMENGLFLDYVGKIVLDNEIKYLLIEKGVYFIVNILDDNFSSVDVFAVDENDEIILLMMHNSDLGIRGNRVYRFDNNYLNKEFEENDELDDLRVAFEYYQDDNEYPMLESINLIPIPPFQDKYSFYNAIIVYTQNNLDTKVMLQTSSFYNGKFDGTDLINEGYFKEPYLVKLVSLAHGFSVIDDREYYLTEWDKGDPYYDLALIKTVGVFDYLFKSFKNSFSFYYNKQIIDSNGQVNLENLLSSGMFDMNDIDKKLLVRGLSRDVPRNLIDLFNRENKDYLFCKSVLDEYKKLDDSVKLTYKYKCGDYND